MAFASVSFAQDAGSARHASEEIRFGRHLVENKAYRDAIAVLRSLPGGPVLTQGQRDSVRFLMAWSHFAQREVDSALLHFPYISRTSVFYEKSVFYQSFGQIYLGRTDSARKVLASVGRHSDSTLWQLDLYHRACMALLDRNDTEFIRLRKRLSNPHYPIAAEVANLDQYRADLLKIKKRSPVVAGIMSAVIPGSGKMYAGYGMQGLAALVQVLSFGAAAAESYRKAPAGPRSARFIAFGSLFTVFYVGNIWGSALSVKIKRNERYREIDQAILVDLRVPLVRLFP